MRMNALRFGLLLAASTALVPFGASAMAEDNPWVQQDPQFFSARSLSLDELIANTVVAVNPQAAGITVRLEGKTDRLALVRVHQDGASVIVEMDGHGEGDWIEEWLDWSFEDTDESTRDLKVWVEVPDGAAIAASEYIGDIEVGSTNGPFALSGIGSIDAVIGNVSSASIEVAGGGDVQILSVSGATSIAIAGSGDVTIGSSHATSISVAGSGDVALGKVEGGLEVEIAGSGECVVDSLNGAVSVSIAGSGDVRIRDGRADPVEVSVAGSGSFLFNGEAVNPEISVVGSGDIWFASYSGQLSADGADIRIGGTPDDDLTEPARAPRAPSAPPAPPAPPAPVPPVSPN